jgi:hypothetical protein
MPNIVKNVLAVSASVGSIAIAAATRTGGYALLAAAGTVIVLAVIASFTWLRTIKMVDQLGRDSRRLPMINKVLGWEDQQVEQGRLFEFTETERIKRRGHRN